MAELLVELVDGGKDIGFRRPALAGRGGLDFAEVSAAITAATGATFPGLVAVPAEMTAPEATYVLIAHPDLAVTFDGLVEKGVFKLVMAHDAANFYVPSARPAPYPIIAVAETVREGKRGRTYGV